MFTKLKFIFVLATISIRMDIVEVHLLLCVITSLYEASSNFWCFWRRIHEMIDFSGDRVKPPSYYSSYQNLIRHLYKQLRCTMSQGFGIFPQKSAYADELQESRD